MHASTCACVGLLRGHGEINIYNDNNCTSSLKRFQQRNVSTSVSLLNKHFIWIIYHMMAEAAASDIKVNKTVQNLREKKSNYHAKQ